MVKDNHVKVYGTCASQVTALCITNASENTHTPESQVPDHIVCKTSASRGDHNEASPSIIRLVQLIIPILLTFVL